MNELARRIIPINGYKDFIDGWSSDTIIGLLIDKDMNIRDIRMGFLNESEGLVYDLNGDSFLASHLLVLRPGDLHVCRTKIQLRKNAFWTPSKGQMDALTHIVKKLPENKDLRALLEGLKGLTR